MVHTAKVAVIEPVKIIGEFPGVYRVGMLRNVTLTKWLGGPLGYDSAASIGALTHQIIADMHGQRWSSLHLIDSIVKMPDSAGRQELANVIRGTSDSMGGCIAVVIEADGFIASALRGLVTGLRVLAPRSFDVRIEATIADLLTWLPEEHYRRTGVDVGVKDIERLCSVGRSWHAQDGGEPLA